MPEPVSIALGLYLAGYASLRAYARPGTAVSEEACIVGQLAAGVADAAQGSEALFGPKVPALEALAALARECAESGWDGYDAKPINPWAVQAAERIIRALPEGLPVPEVSAEPDGDVALEWLESRYRRLSLSVGTDARLAYAWMDGTDKGHAAAGFDGARLPERLVAEIRRIMSPAGASLRAA
jgi:hypothetical protein